MLPQVMVRSHAHLLGSTVAVLLSLAVGGSAAAFTSGAQSQDIPPDARAQGMGRAFTAIAEGPSAGWWNPAALAEIREIAVSPYSKARLVPDFSSDTYIRTYAAAVPIGPVGVAVHRSSLDYGTQPGGFESSESTNLLGAGLDLVPILADRPSPWEAQVGLNVKWVRAHQDTPLADLTGNGYDLDAGVRAGYRIPLGVLRPEDSSLRFRAAAVRRNVFDREIKYSPADKDPLIRIDRVGLAAELALIPVPVVGNLVRIVGGLDRELSPYEDEKDITTRGLEVSLLGMFAIRRGHIEDKSGQVVDDTDGYGVGFDLDLSERSSVIRRIGCRFDHATVPQARGLERVTHESL
ncbi:MAG: hypothetical protein KC729_09305, partial [Candidatus Eisenbacteria bacterium]|nr:hypothetical protein [Candidatus Eisenbacteria bacterium]